MNNKDIELNELIRLLERYQQELINEEEFYDRCKRKLVEMARDKDYILGMFDSKKHMIVMHLICCYMWTESQWYDHWKDEIHSFLFELPKLKTTKKYPSREDLEKWFMEEIRENLEDRLKKYIRDTMEKEKQDKLPKYNIEKLHEYLLKYFKWLCDNLSDGNSISNKEVSEEIDNLIKRYK